MNRLRLLLLGLTILVPAIALAQTTGTIQGTVTFHDPDGGPTDGTPAPYVSVVLTSERKGHDPKYETTDENGAYKFSGVETGVYLLHAEDTLAGYIPFEQVRITMYPGSLEKENLQIAKSDKVEETMIITANKDVIPDIEKTDVRRSLDAETIKRVPLANNRVQDLMKLMPGVMTNGGSESEDISVGGGTSDQIAYILNGANFTDALFGGPAGGVSSMAIERFELISGGFQPEYGTAATGIANIITKSGSDEIEFQYALTWRDIEAIGSELDDLSGVQDLWNDLLNGSLVRGFNVRDDLIDGLGGLPSTLSDDPNPSPRQRVQHQVGVGGPIVLGKVFFYTNLDVLTNDFGSAFTDDEVTEDVLTYLAKVTWEVNENNKFWAELNIELTDTDGVNLPGLDPITGTEDTNGAWTLAFHDRHAFTSEGFLKDSFIEMNLNWNHRYITNRAASPGVDHQVNVFLPPAGLAALTMEGPSEELDYTVNDYRISASLTKPFKKHNIKLGGEWGLQTLQGTRERFRVFNDFRVMRAEGIGGDPTAGLPSLGQIQDPGAPQVLDESTQLASVYLQDLWTVTDNLTLEPGIRIDYQDFVDKILIAPRIGFSLDIAGNGQTQLQGNYGHFYQNLFLNALLWDLRPDNTLAELIAGEDATAETVGFPVIRIDDLVAATEGFDEGIKTLGRIFPLVTQQFDIDEDLTSPLNEQWSLRVRRNLPQNVILDVTYTEAERDNALTVETDTVSIGRNNEPGIQRLKFATNGREEFQQWIVAVQKAFDNGWQLNASYTQQKILGPTVQAGDPLDPTRVQVTFGPLGRDRTEIIQMSTSVDLPWKMTLSANFRYQTGVPITPTVFDTNTTNISTKIGEQVLATRNTTVQPFGVNSMRLPPFRSLDLTVARSFKWGEDNSLEARVSVFNLTNEFNVISALGTVGELTDPNPLNNLPLRPGILPTLVDVPRSIQLEFRLSF